MASILGGLAGAGGGFATGGPIGAALGGLAGLFGGGGQRMSAAQRAALEQQRAIANQLFNYAQSQPMTGAEDLNNLAQSYGLLGQQQRSELGSLAAFGNPDIPTGGLQDMIANLQSANVANRMSIQEQHLADAIAARRQALLQAAGVNAQAAEMAGQPGAVQANPLGGTLANLAQAVAYAQAQKQRNPVGGEGEGESTANINPATGAPYAANFNVPNEPAANAANPVPTALPPGLGAAGAGAPSAESGGGLAEPPFAFQGAPAVGGVGTAFPPQPGFTGPPLPPALAGGAGDSPAAPAHDPLQHAMTILQMIVKHHLANSKKKPAKKRKGGAGDAPALPLPGVAPGQAMSARSIGQQGAAAPGNEPGGANSVANQMRQPGSAMLDRLRFPSGAVFPY